MVYVLVCSKNYTHYSVMRIIWLFAGVIPQWSKWLYGILFTLWLVFSFSKYMGLDESGELLETFFNLQYSFTISNLTCFLFKILYLLVDMLWDGLVFTRWIKSPLFTDWQKLSVSRDFLELLSYILLVRGLFWENIFVFHRHTFKW